MVRGYTLGYGIHIPDIFRTFLEAKTRIYKIKALGNLFCIYTFFIKVGFVGKTGIFMV